MKPPNPFVAAALLAALLGASCIPSSEEVLSSQRSPNWQQAPSEALTSAKEIPAPAIYARTHIAAGNLDRVAHHRVVILLPNPVARGKIGATDEPDEYLSQIVGSAYTVRRYGRLRPSFGKGAFIFWRELIKGPKWDIRNFLALVAQGQVLCIGRDTNHRKIEPPFFKIIFTCTKGSRHTCSLKHDIIDYFITRNYSFLYKSTTFVELDCHKRFWIK